MAREIILYLCRKGVRAVASAGAILESSGAASASSGIQVSSADGGKEVKVKLLRRGQSIARKVKIKLYTDTSRPEYAWPTINLVIARTDNKRSEDYTRSDTWSIEFTTPDGCEHFSWGLYRWSGEPGYCCSNRDTAIALSAWTPLPDNLKSLPLSRQEASPRARVQHRIQLDNDDLYPGDLFCLYGTVRLPTGQGLEEFREVVGHGDGEASAPALSDLRSMVTGRVLLTARCAGRIVAKYPILYDSLGSGEAGGDLDIRSGRWMREIAWPEPPEADAPITAVYRAEVTTWGEPVSYPLDATVFATDCFSGGRVLAEYENDDGYEYDIQVAAKVKDKITLNVVRGRPSDHRRYATGQWVTIKTGRSKCRALKLIESTDWEIPNPHSPYWETPDPHSPDWETPDPHSPY